MNTKSISVVLFVLLFLVGGVLVYAVSKGGMDIRSRASGTQSCITITTSTCPSGYTKTSTSGVYAGTTCCKNMPTPTPVCSKEGEGVAPPEINCCAGLELKQVTKGAEQVCVRTTIMTPTGIQRPTSMPTGIKRLTPTPTALQRPTLMPTPTPSWISNTYSTPTPTSSVNWIVCNMLGVGCPTPTPVASN